MQIRVRKKILRTLFYIGLVILLFMWLIPLSFCLFTAIKTNNAFYHQPVFSFPKEIEFDNFVNAFQVMAPYMKNGLIVSVLKVPLGIFVEALAAFAITRLHIKGATGFFVFFLIGMMVPHQATLIPINIALSRLQLTNTYLGLFYVYVAFGIAFGVMVLRGFMRGIPFEIDESARIDGASNWKLFTNIILPISRPAFSTLIIMDFLSTWNEFLLASVLITDDTMRTVPAGLLRFHGEAGVHYPTLCAAILVSILPVLVLYLIFQRYFVEGISGAVKG